MYILLHTAWLTISLNEFNKSNKCKLKQYTKVRVSRGVSGLTKTVLKWSRISTNLQNLTFRAKTVRLSLLNPNEGLQFKKSNSDWSFSVLSATYTSHILEKAIWLNIHNHWRLTKNLSNSGGIKIFHSYTIC